MRFRVTLLSMLLASGLAAQAQAPSSAAAPADPTTLPLCDQPVRFAAAWFADPEIDNGKSVAELSKLGAGPGGGGGTQLGHVMVETKLSVTPQTTCRGAIVRLEYLKPVLRVASEFAPGSCAHARVMTHEQTHVRIHREIARQFRELRYPWADGRGGGSAALLTWAKQELDRLMRAQELFDSPEEYARSQTVCNGEIAKRLQPAAAPAAKKP